MTKPPKDRLVPGTNLANWKESPTSGPATTQPYDTQAPTVRCAAVLPDWYQNNHPWQQDPWPAAFFADGGTSLAGFRSKKPLGLSTKPM